MHASQLAKAVGIRKVVIPMFAGVASALGMLITDPKFHFSLTFIAKLDGDILPKLKEIYDELEFQGRASLEICGVPGTFRFNRSCDMRYLGQGHEINIQVMEKDLNEVSVDILKTRFNEEYKRNYGYTDEDAELEIVTIKLEATCQTSKFDLKMRGGKSKTEDPKKEERKIYIHEERGYLPCPVYDRDKLYSGFKTRGPAIVEERTSSTVVLPRDGIEVDGLGNLVITME
jgi:N-methylhydantoinase A